MKRGRKSAADLMSVVRISGARLPAPTHFTDSQKVEWDGIVNSLPADYFRPSDVALLTAYCVASDLHKKATMELALGGITMMDDRGKEYVNPLVAMLTSTSGTMAQMAVKLRLCPSARYTDKSAATKSAATGGVAARPWETTGTE